MYDSLKSLDIILFMLTVLSSRLLVKALPQPQSLQSLLPLEPIEEPPTWAWANHPRQGFSYKAKDSLSVEVCLENPKLIATAKCQLPLDVCLANPQYISQVGCSGQLDNLPPLSLDVCITFIELITLPACSGNKYSLDICAQNPSLLTTSSCTGEAFIAIAILKALYCRKHLHC